MCLSYCDYLMRSDVVAGLILPLVMIVCIQLRFEVVPLV